MWLVLYFHPVYHQILILYSVRLPFRNLNTRYFLASFIFQIAQAWKHCLVMRPITLTSHCQESSRLEEETCWGSLFYSWNARKEYIGRYGTIHRFDPSTHFFLLLLLLSMLCVCVVICTISLWVQVDKPMSFLLFSPWFLGLHTLQISFFFIQEREGRAEKQSIHIDLHSIIKPDREMRMHWQDPPNRRLSNSNCRPSPPTSSIHPRMAQ